MQFFGPFPFVMVDGSSKETDLGSGAPGVIAEYVYERDILRILRDISGTFSGSDLFNQMAKTGRSLVIVPYSFQDQAEMGPIDAFAAPDDVNSSEPRGLHQEGMGGGSDVTLHFSKETPFASLGPIGTAPDEVLFHEMVHALRQMQGLNEGLDAGDQDAGYLDEEEFIAIVITNIYVSEKTPTDPPPPLRKDHSGADALPASESTSVGFLLSNSENLFWIKWLFTQDADYFNAIAGNPMAVFNPIREYVVHQAIYNSMSQYFVSKSYTVGAGDTPRKIADEQLGDANKWPIIYALNSRTIGPDPDVIVPGQVLNIPTP